MEGTDRLDTPVLAFEDYLALPESEWPFEIVDGRRIVSPSPTGRHQIAAFKLALILDRRRNACRSSPGRSTGCCAATPLLVRQPDLVVVERERARADRLTAPPLVAVEVATPATRETDLVTKRAQYAEAGLAWFWLVDVDFPQVVVLRNDAGVFTVGRGCG